MLLEELVQQHNLKYGENTCVSGAQLAPHSIRLPTGIFSLDFALCGGLPMSQMVCFKGPPAGGKTSSAINTAAVASRMCWRCNKLVCECSLPPLQMKTLWLDVEGTFDKQWATDIGLDEDSYVIVTAEDMEQYAEIAVASLKGEDVGLIVVDSIAALTPSRVLEGSSYTTNMGVIPKAVKDFLRKLNPVLVKEGFKGHQVVVILINQVMYKVGEMFGSPETMPGGEALKHFTSLWVRFAKKSLTDAEKKQRDENRKVNLVQRHTFSIEKQKVTILAGGGEFVRCKEPIRDSNNNIEYARGELLEYNTVIKQGKLFNALTPEGSKWRMGDAVGTQKEIKEFWRANPSMYLAAQREIIERAQLEIFGA